MSELDSIKEILKKKDCQGLIKLGAPDDEYDSEALSIYQKINKEDTIQNICKKIWETFYDSFCTGTDSHGNHFKNDMNRAIEIIGSLEDYRTIAKEIKDILSKM